MRPVVATAFGFPAGGIATKHAPVTNDWPSEIALTSETADVERRMTVATNRVRSFP